MKSLAVALVAVLSLAGWARAQQPLPQSPPRDSPPSKVDASPGSGAALPEAAGPAKAQVDPSKQADIRRLLRLLNADALVAQLMEATEKSMQPLLSQSLPQGEYRDQLVTLFFEKFRQHSESAHFTDLLVPIYDKYYTAGEIRQLIEFYQTPLGAKMVAVLPQITAESQAAGREWGGELGRESMTEVLKEHPELEKALEDAAKNTRQP